MAKWSMKMMLCSCWLSPVYSVHLCIVVEARSPAQVPHQDSELQPSQGEVDEKEAIDVLMKMERE